MGRQRKDRRRHGNGGHKGPPPRPRRLPAIATLALVAVALVVVQKAMTTRTWPSRLTSGSASGANVLLITLDTTRADRLGCYGYAQGQTPNLDALTDRGVRFDDAVTVVPVTLPSHATILTGLDPPNHGVRHNGEYRLSDPHTTLAELLRANGYATAAFVAAFVLDARFGLEQGFDLYDDDMGPSEHSLTDFTRPIYQRPASAVSDRVIAWLAQRDTDRPFFAWVHYFDPHTPRRPPAPYAARFPGKPYDAEIAYMDAQIGRLLAALGEKGILEHTLVVAVADHGESLGEHGEDTHGKLLYEGTMRVPLILSYPPKIHRPCVVDDVVVSVADVTPTILDLLGISTTIALDGRSLLDARLDARRMLYIETLAPYLDSGWAPLYGIRRHADKYILAPTPEYYDLASDRKEAHNLFETAAGVQLAARDSLVRELSAQAAGTDSLAQIVAAAHKLDAHALKGLQTLGYVGSIEPPPEAPEELPDPKEMMPVQRAIDQADGLAAAGRLDEALTIVTGVVRDFPRDAKALLTLGKIYLHQNRRTDAEQTLRKTLALRPSARGYVLLAQLMIAELRVEEAGVWLDEAQRLEPLHGGIFLARGDWFALQGRPLEAIASYERAEKVDPNRASAEARARIAQIRKIMRKIKEGP